MRTNHRLVCFALTTSMLLLASVEARAAGKLRRARSATSVSSKNQRSKTKQKTKDEDESKKKKAKQERQRSSARQSEHKLASISRTTRAHDHRSASKPSRGPNRRARHHRPHRHAHRPHRSPLRLGMHFYSAPTPVVYETVVTEELYAPQPQPVTTYSPPPCPNPPTERVILEEPTIYSPPSHDVTFENPWHVRFGAEFGTNANDISQVGFGLVANRHAGFGIDTELKLFQERGGDYRDHLWLGDFNIVYELFPTERFRPRAGIGVNWLADHYGGEAGLNLTLGVDLRLAEHLILSGETDFGTLGDADMFHGRVTAGLTHGPVEWFAGYDHRDIGGVEIQGILAGLRFRF